jgi:hypothetical protein
MDCIVAKYSEHLGEDQRMLHFQVPLDATVAVVHDNGVVVSYAWTSKWSPIHESYGVPIGAWDTLDAFTVPHLRMRGLASYAAAGLVASGLFDNDGGTVAVFRPSMMIVARNVGLWPRIFRRPR